MHKDVQKDTRKHKAVWEKIVLPQIGLRCHKAEMMRRENSRGQQHLKISVCLKRSWEGYNREKQLFLHNNIRKMIPIENHWVRDGRVATSIITIITSLPFCCSGLIFLNLLPLCCCAQGCSRGDPRTTQHRGKNMCASNRE